MNSDRSKGAHEASRRDFLRASALAAATSVAHNGFARTAESDAPGFGLDDLKWDKAPCRFCGTGCHVRVGVAEGKVRAIQGDPLADVNKGLLCV